MEYNFWWFYYFVFTLTDILLAPLNFLLNSFLPDSFTYIDYFVTGLFDKLSEVSKFVISYTGFYSYVLDIVILLVVSIFTLPLAVHGIKTAVRWFRTFKL